MEIIDVHLSKYVGLLIHGLLQCFKQHSRLINEFKCMTVLLTQLIAI